MSASRHVGGSLDPNLPKAKDVAFIKRNEANRLCLALILRLFNYHSGHLKGQW